ncbi:hypothetical protein [Paludisphaera soli]|uniref:hypothetical protein n=1 Tax=Paludisphaera soli TaxID=2712865 RepID=UPI0013EA5502|nr:hypothetical protein [Paludisphaera soli]
MIERGRAYRRQQWQRAKARAVRLVRLLGLSLDPPRVALAYAVDRKPCSCWMCGNPRRHLGERTRQERRFDD